MSDYKKMQTLVNKLTTLEDSIQEIPVDDNVVKDDDLIVKNKNLVESMYNLIMGATLGVPVNVKINSDKLQKLSKGLKTLAHNQSKLTTKFGNPEKMATVDNQIKDVSQYIHSIQA